MNEQVGYVVMVHVVWTWCKMKMEGIKMENECFSDLMVHCEVVKKMWQNVEEKKKKKEREKNRGGTRI